MTMLSLIKDVARASLGPERYEDVRQQYYRAEQAHRALPDFLIVGTQRGLLPKSSLISTAEALRRD